MLKSQPWLCTSGTDQPYILPIPLKSHFITCLCSKSKVSSILLLGGNWSTYIAMLGGYLITQYIYYWITMLGTKYFVITVVGVGIKLIVIVCR